MRSFLCIFLILVANSLIAQFKISGYGEMYYNYDFSQENRNTRDAWFYNHNLQNTIAPNLFILETNYKTKDLYMQLDLMFGSYAGAIMANEPIWAKPVYQAYIGTTAGNFDIEAGIFESGVGLESAKGMDNPTLTRSIFAENTPYFLTGIRSRWEDNTGIIMIEGAIVNGWETVVRHATLQNTTPGGLFRLRLGSKKVHVHYNLLYTEDAGGINISVPRLLNGIYFKHALNTLQWFLGYDNVKTDDNNVHMPYLILRKEISERFAFALRGEYARDFTRTRFLLPQSIDTPGGTLLLERDFEVWSASLNVDYSPRKNLLLRTEIRYMEGQTEQLPRFPGPGFSDFNIPYKSFLLSASACVKF
jgi:hypothetical protein